MRTKTWKDKTTDVSNSWLSATRSEDDGLFQEASVFYLEDAQGSLRRDLKVRAALSCACAASCIERTGGYSMARRLYLEAARLYEEQANASLAVSLREGLWLLQEAHDFYVLGDDPHKAAEIYDACVSLARKLNPFATKDTIGSMLRIRNSPARVPPILVNSQNASHTAEVNETVEEFLRLREAMAGEKATPLQVSVRRLQGRPSIEKGIAS